MYEKIVELLFSRMFEGKIKDLLIKYKSIIIYLIVGGLTTLVNFVVYYFDLLVLDMPYKLNICVAWVAAVIFAYFPNKYIVFESKGEGKGLGEFVKFVGSRISTLLFELVAMFLFIDIIGVKEIIAKVVVAVFVVVLNYVLSKLIVFRKK